MSFGRPLAVRSWLWLLLVPLLLATSRPSAAQRVTVDQPKPDCRIWRKAWDQPFGGSYSIKIPRVAWHAERFVLGAVLTKTLERLHVPKPIARLAPATLSTALHLRGALRHEYAMNPGDWIADNIISSPASMPIGVYGALYLPAACFASP